MTTATAADCAVFTPCVEDATGCPRHPSASQDSLCHVNRALLRQIQASLATAALRQRTSPEQSSSCEQSVWRSTYATLWEQREGVPDNLKREWQDTAVVCMSRFRSNPTSEGPFFDADLLAFDWLLRIPLFFDPAVVPALYAEHVSVQQAPGEEGHSSAQGKKRKKRDRKWVLWEDTARGHTGIHYLTIPTVARGAFRPLDVSRLEGTAFSTRVRAWLAATATPPSLCSGSPNGAVKMPPFPSDPPASCEDADDIKLFQLLAALQVRATGTVSPALQQLRGALRYRMIVELMCCRLSERPRCLPTWRLLAESLHTVLLLSTTPLDCPVAARVAATGVTLPMPAAALVRGLQQYITRFLVPFLEMRDRYVSVMHNTFTYALRDELLRVAGGQGVWATTFTDSDPSFAQKWGAASVEDRVRVILQALLEVCGFVDEAPSTTSLSGGIDHSLVLGYTGVTGEGGDDDEVATKVFDSPSSRQKCLAAFIEQFFLLSPLEAFDRIER